MAGERGVSALPDPSAIVQVWQQPSALKIMAILLRRYWQDAQAGPAELALKTALYIPTPLLQPGSAAPAISHTELLRMAQPWHHAGAWSAPVSLEPALTALERAGLLVREGQGHGRRYRLDNGYRWDAGGPLPGRADPRNVVQLRSLALALSSAGAHERLATAWDFNEDPSVKRPGSLPNTRRAWIQWLSTGGSAASFMTFGGEVEVASVGPDGALKPTPPEALREAEAAMARLATSGSPFPIPNGFRPAWHYDAAMSTPEASLGVHPSITSLVYWAWQAVAVLNDVLNARGQGLYGGAVHPLTSAKEAYDNVTPKPLYLLFRGPGVNPTRAERGWLYEIFGSDSPESGRGYSHFQNANCFGVHAWGRTPAELAADTVGLAGALASFFNLVGSNSPVMDGQIVARDARLLTWGRFLATSRYPGDRDLERPMPADRYISGSRGFSLARYYRFVLGFCPLAVKDPRADEAANAPPLAVVRPKTPGEWSWLDLLEQERFEVVDINGTHIELKPSLVFAFNGNDTLYWPATGSRIRVWADPVRLDAVDPRRFARAVRNGDDAAVVSLLRRAGVDEPPSAMPSHVCTENRTFATVLPARLWEHYRLENFGWSHLALPFVINGVLPRCQTELRRVLVASGLTWHQLSQVLPARTNMVGPGGGFDAAVRVGSGRSGGRGREVRAVDLARRCWDVIRRSMTPEELGLIRGPGATDIVSYTLETGNGPADLQLRYLDDLGGRGITGRPAIEALMAQMRVPEHIQPPSLGKPAMEVTLG